MTEAMELIETVEAAGGKFKVDGERLGIFPAAVADSLVEGLRLHKAEIIGLLQNRPSPQSEGRDQYGLGLWLIARCVADAGWSTSIAALHADFCRWREKGELPKATLAGFAAMLSEAGFATIVGFTQNLALEIDWLAQQQFEHPTPASAPPMPAKRTSKGRAQ